MRRLGWGLWPLAVVVGLGHLSFGALAGVEYAPFARLASEPYEFIAVGVVAASAVLAVAGAVSVAWPAVRGHRALRRLLRDAGRPWPVPPRETIEALGLAGRVDVVVTG